MKTWRNNGIKKIAISRPAEVLENYMTPESCGQVTYIFFTNTYIYDIWLLTICIKLHSVSLISVEKHR